VDEAPRPQMALAGSNSKLHPRVVTLMKMLFDLETYKYENRFNTFSLSYINILTTLRSTDIRMDTGFLFHGSCLGMSRDCIHTGSREQLTSVQQNLM